MDRVDGAPTIAAALMLVAMLLSVAGADESETRDYQIPLGASAFGFDRAFIVCPHGCDLDEDGTNESGPLGGAIFHAGMHRAALVSAADTAWGTDVAMSVCIYSAGERCSPEIDEGSSSSGCGPRSVYNMWAEDPIVSVFVQGLSITSELEVCGGTRGTVTANWM